VHVDFLLADGTIPVVYDTAAERMVPVPHPEVTVREITPVLYAISVRRCFPVSSSHGGSPCRLCISVAGEVLVTAPFIVYAQKPENAPKRRRRAVEVPPCTATRLSALSVFQAFIRSQASINSGPL